MPQAGHGKELEKIVVSPVNGVLRRVWDFVMSNATRQLNTAMNLMLFDNQAAIERDIASAVAGR